MYKTKTMRKPLFYSLKDCELNIELCEESSILNWVNEKYKNDLWTKKHTPFNLVSKFNCFVF